MLNKETSASASLRRRPSGAGAGPKPGTVEHSLRERIKELDCLYGIVDLWERHEHSLEQFMQAVAERLPAGWQYPDDTCVRVVYEGTEYVSPGFRETPYRQAADIVVNGTVSGAVEVVYSKKMPPADEGPFLKEERDLINAVALKVGTFAERVRAEEALRKAHNQLQVERHALQEANAALRVLLARIEEEKAAIKESIAANIQKIVMPILIALEAEVRVEKKGYVQLIRRNLEDIASPLLDQLSRKFRALTPTELAVCNMIQMGLGTKEIARLRHISPATVNRHRESIRRKLGLTGEGVNLASFFQTFRHDLERAAPP